MARSAKKAEFVKKHIDKSPAEIMAAGKAQGLTLSPSYIGKLRTEQKRVRHVGRVTVSAPLQRSVDELAEFRRLVWRLGTVRVRAWLAGFDRETSRDDEHV
jgi:hypothetical protein